MIIKIGNMYVKSFFIEEYGDKEIRLSFTNIIEKAEKFDSEIYIEMVKLLLDIENVEIIKIEEEEKKDE